MNQSIHSIDLLQWLMGRVSSVYAYTDTLVHHMEMEDVAVAVLRFASGALGTISATAAAYRRIPSRLEVFGEKGSAVIENENLSYLHVAQRDQENSSIADSDAKQRKQAPDKVSLFQRLTPFSAESHARQIADMIRAIREQTAPLVDGYAARYPIEIILSIYESAQTRKEVSLA